MKTWRCEVSGSTKKIVVLLVALFLCLFLSQSVHAAVYVPPVGFSSVSPLESTADTSGLLVSTSIPDTPSNVIGVAVTGLATYTPTSTGTVTVGYDYYSDYTVSLTGGQLYKISIYFKDYIWANRGGITLESLTLTSAVSSFPALSAVIV
jgi:hypothetical protein